jgi:branched-chain amino acid transport system substrate-binding protein
MKRTLSLLALTLALGGIVLSLTGCPNKPKPPEPDTSLTVKIAANLPLTGALSTYGVAVRDGANMAVEELKAEDPAGPTLNLDWQDNASDPKTAVTIFQKQYLSPPDIYVSGVKPQYMAIKDQAKAKGTPHFVWVFDPVLNPDSTNNLRTWVSYKIEPPVYLDYAKKIGAKRVAIVYVQLPHSVEEINDLVVPGLNKQGIADILVEPYDFGKTDFKDVAVKFKNFKPDLMILNGFQQELVGLIRALRPLKLITDGNTLATYDLLDAAKILGADEIEGVRQVAPVCVSRPDTPVVKEWTTRFQVKYNSDPLYTHMYGYDMMQVINDAATRVEKPAGAAEWIAALKATKIEGVTGPLEFDADNDLVTPLEVAVYRNGKLVPDAPKTE